MTRLFMQTDLSLSIFYRYPQVTVSCGCGWIAYLQSAKVKFRVKFCIDTSNFYKSRQFILGVNWCARYLKSLKNNLLKSFFQNYQILFRKI